MRYALALIVVLCAAGCSTELRVAESSTASQPAAAVRPNILLIVVDDMAFSDLGSFGGEIDTPNLDRLAIQGIRFTNFQTATMCSPSRAMLLTGVDSHLAGFGNMKEELSPNQKGQPGYEGYLNERVTALPQLLQKAGYRTYMTGKWHLGSGEVSGPSFRGFDRSFALDSGGASHFSDMRPAYAPSPEIKANYSQDGVKLTELPEDFEYSSQYYVDLMIDYLKSDKDKQAPFFAYLSFTAPHWPLQAPDDAIARQAGKYDAGFDVLADARLKRSIAMGLVSDDAVRGSRSPKEQPWASLSPEQQKIEARAMEVYAAMIVEMDRHTGRLLDFLESDGSLDNTVVLFLSDNGAEGHDLDETWPAEAFPEIRRTIDASHDFTYENMGRLASYTLYGPNWANAGSPAFRLHKGFPTEGGTRATAFMYYPQLIKTPVITDEFVFIKDVTPTLLELADVSIEGSQSKTERITGESFVPILTGEKRKRQPRANGIELLGKRAVRLGDWKLVHMPKPWGTGDWQLFNVKNDVAEANDLAAENPQIVADLLEHWAQYAEANNVIIPDWVSGY